MTIGLRAPEYPIRVPVHWDPRERVLWRQHSIRDFSAHLNERFPLVLYTNLAPGPGPVPWRGGGFSEQVVAALLIWPALPIEALTLIAGWVADALTTAHRGTGWETSAVGRAWLTSLAVLILALPAVTEIPASIVTPLALTAVMRPSDSPV